MPHPDKKPMIGGHPATVDGKGRWWINMDGRDPKMGRVRIVKDPKTGNSSQGNGIDNALDMLDEANEAMRRFGGNNPQSS